MLFKSRHQRKTCTTAIFEVYSDYIFEKKLLQFAPDSKRLSITMCSCLCRCLFAIAWFLILIFIAYPVAFFMCGWYVLLCPLEACCPACDCITKFLLKCTQLPLICTRNMLEGKGFC
ncbi:hypothetical protein JTE90_012315 [Oedothorax gibbosus]|uniref:Caveolin n=1 Tax=Oedothorax gibbosus TaxID=931172 RepID=A0AAV6VIE5_9ARAC|nr:hypothetical protein JTE90_012315 [Oedothorax gibbosus]